MQKKKSKNKDGLRINCIICGRPFSEAKELKQEGVVRNNADLVRQGVSALYQRIVDERLKTLRMKAFEQTEQADAP
jgi:hypothetical protein